MLVQLKWNILFFIIYVDIHGAEVKTRVKSSENGFICISSYIQPKLDAYLFLINVIQLIIALEIWFILIEH